MIPQEEGDYYKKSSSGTTAQASTSATNAGYGVPGSQYSKTMAEQSSPSYTETKQENGIYYGRNSVTGNWEQISHLTPQQMGESQYADQPANLKAYDYNTPGSNGVMILNKNTGKVEPGVNVNGEWVPGSIVGQGKQETTMQNNPVDGEFTPFKYLSVEQKLGGGTTNVPYYVLPDNTPIRFDVGFNEKSPGYSDERFVKAKVKSGYDLRNGYYDVETGEFVVTAKTNKNGNTIKDLGVDEWGPGDTTFISRALSQKVGSDNNNIIDNILGHKANAQNVNEVLVGGPDAENNKNVDIDNGTFFGLFPDPIKDRWVPMNWGGEQVKVDKFNKGIFDTGMAIIEGGEILSNMLPEGPTRSIGGAVIKTASSIPAGLLMAPTAATMLGEIAVNHPNTVKTVFGGTPGFMVEQKKQEYANDPLEAIVSDALSAGLIIYGGVKLAGGLPKTGVVNDPMLTGVSGRSLSSELGFKLNAAAEIAKTPAEYRPGVQAAIDIMSKSDKIDYRTNIEPGFENVEYVPRGSEPAIRNVLENAPKDTRTYGSTTEYSEITNYPGEIEVNARTPHDIDILTVNEGSETLATTAANEINRVLGYEAAKVEGNTVIGEKGTILDIHDASTPEPWALDSKLLRPPLEKQLYKPGKLGYTGKFSSESLTYGTMRKSQATIQYIKDAANMDYHRVHDIADVINDAKVLKEFTKNKNPIISAKLGKDIETLSNQKFPYGEQGKPATKQLTGKEIYDIYYGPNKNNKILSEQPRRISVSIIRKSPSKIVSPKEIISSSVLPSIGTSKYSKNKTSSPVMSSNANNSPSFKPETIKISPLPTPSPSQKYTPTPSPSPPSPSPGSKYAPTPIPSPSPIPSLSYKKSTSPHAGNSMSIGGFNNAPNTKIINKNRKTRALWENEIEAYNPLRNNNKNSKRKYNKRHKK